MGNGRSGSIRLEGVTARKEPRWRHDGQHTGDDRHAAWRRDGRGPGVIGDRATAEVLARRGLGVADAGLAWTPLRRVV